MSDTVTTTTKGAAHLTAEQFQALIDTAKTPVLVDFFAEWCGPCRMAAPIIDKLADEYRNQMAIAKLDVDAYNQVAATHGVMSIPTVIVFKDKKEVDRQIGFPGEDGYRQLIEKHLQS